MYIYTLQAMPGSKAKFDGDTSVLYRVRRTQTSTSDDRKSQTDVIRTNLGYEEAMALVKRFNDKEGESRSARNEQGSHPTPGA